MSKSKEAARETEQLRAPDKYDVLVSFTDPDDKTATEGANIYWAGKNQYPRDGYRPTSERVAYLHGNKNAFRRPVISGTPKQ